VHSPYNHLYLSVGPLSYTSFPELYNLGVGQKETPLPAVILLLHVYLATRQQAVAKTLAKRSAYQILSVVVLFVV
jgi:hypothetical protein